MGELNDQDDELLSPDVVRLGVLTEMADSLRFFADQNARLAEKRMAHEKEMAVLREPHIRRRETTVRVAIWGVIAGAFLLLAFGAATGHLDEIVDALPTLTIVGTVVSFIAREMRQK